MGGGGVEGGRHRGVPRDPADAEGVGLGADAREDQGDEVARRHLRVAGHVPRRAPAQRPGERVVDRLDARGERLERPLVQADLGVGQVALVEQQQVGLLLPDELLDLGQLTLDVGLQRRTPDEPAVDLVVEADAQAVPAQRRVVGVRGLHHRERREGAVVVQLEPRLERVDARGLEPLLGPGLELAAAGLLQRHQQVLELGVAEREVLEVALDALEEVLQADPGDQLLEHRRALGVGDAVEVDLHGLQVVVVRGDRVGRGQLVLAVGPVLAGVGEAGPGLGELGGLDRGVVAGPLGERLVEPEVVPPPHRHQVAEPHVRHLVEDHLGAELVEGAVLAAAREVLVAERDAPGVLHRAHVVLRHEQLVVLAERVGVAEGLLEELEALLGDLDQLVGVEVLDQRLAAVEAERDVAVLAGVGVLHLVVLAGDQGGDVGRHRLGGLEAPQAPCAPSPPISVAAPAAGSARWRRPSSASAR